MNTKKTIYKLAASALLIALMLCDLIIIKELRSIKKELNNDTSYKIPSLESLDYYKEHELKIKDMQELENIDNSLILFFSDECPMCEITKEDIAAFIYYGFTNKTKIYFVNIDEHPDLVGESDSDSDNLASQKIYGTPTLFELTDNDFKRYEGVDEIYNLLNDYAKR